MGIKVARVIARLNIGGPAIHAISLSRELPTKGFECRLFAGVIPKDEGDMSLLAIRDGIQISVIPDLGREVSFIKDLKAFLTLLSAFRKFRPDIVHTHTAKAGTLGRLAGLCARVPVRVHTFHGHVFHGYFGIVKTHVYLFIERLLARFTDGIVVLCPSQKRELVTTYRIAPEHKVRIIPLGFNFSSFHHCDGVREEKRKVWKMTSSHYVCGFVGRLVSIKNPMLFVKALQFLNVQRDALSNARSLERSIVAGVVVGRGNLEGLLAASIEKNKRQIQIEMLGWAVDMAEIYSALDVVVLTSLNEGTPVVLIEAMAAGKPFVATNVGGVIDLMVGNGNVVKGHNGKNFMVYDNGILVDSHDVEGLSGALCFLMTNQEKGREMGRVGRIFALENFSLARLVQDIQNVYEQLLASKGMA